MRTLFAGFAFLALAATPNRAVTGLLTDEDLITIAGAVVSGVGLYFYLQATR